MTAESGSGDPNSKQTEPASNAGSEVESEKTARKVAKTMFEVASPQVPDDAGGKKVAKTLLEIADPEAISDISASGSVSQNEDSKQAIDQPRKVAKTMLEVPLPDVDKIEPTAPLSVDPQLPTSTEPTKSLPKTKLEMSQPDISQLESAAVPEPHLKTQASEPAGKIAKTMIEVALPDMSNLESSQPIPNESSAPGRTVAKTMLEVSRIDLSIADSTNLSTEVDSTNADAERQRKVARTMLELSLPEESATAKQVRKITKTILDVDTLDAIGMAKALNMPLKIAKSLSQPIIRKRTALSNISDLDKTVKAEDYAGLEKTVKTDDSSDLDRTAKTQDSSDLDRTMEAKDYFEQDRTVKTDIDPYRNERFVAKTMLDHAVLSAALVRSAEKEKIRAGELAKDRANDPVKEFHQVDSKKMATPCAWTWTESGGKDRVRSCSKCQTQVYDFAGMELPEAEALIFKQESRKKASLFKRADGKFMTKDCPVQVQRKRNNFLLCFFGALIMISAIAWMVLMPPQPKPPAPAVVEKSGTSTNAKTHVGSTVPTKGASGSIHFEAGQPVTQSPAFDSITPQVKGTPTPTTTTTSSSEDENKYWDTSTGGK